MSVVIKAENISKIYRLGEIGTGTLSRDLERSWAKLRGKEDPFSVISENRGDEVNSDEWVYSLRDISFQVNAGDAVGIIGRNGAGKSTLLKVLSRVTSPTKGKIYIRGRVASLLEVGTGFHPELTGRENIFLNGAILGMRKREIDRKLDEIIDFSGVEKYIDTPVKRYSSGMYVRLAFAVAAHLESEILIVDEVLAVGDAEFQKKCLSKMGEVTKGQGRTILFVSHNMAAVKKLCRAGLYLKNGKIEYVGSSTASIEKYLLDAKSIRLADGYIPEGASLFNTGLLRFTKFEMNGGKYEVGYKQPIDLDLSIFSKFDVDNVFVDVRIANSEMVEIAHVTHVYPSDNSFSDFINLKAGSTRIGVRIDNLFQPGSYYVTLGVHKVSGETLDFLEYFSSFEVTTVSLSGEDYLFPTDWLLGYLRLNSNWKIHA